jgi:predicted ArsR family transcriptional regulator
MRRGRRVQVLEVLRASDAPLAIADVAKRLGVHSNTVRFHLDTLVRTGQVERVDGPPDRPGRPPLRFRARPGMDPTGPENYRLLAEALLAAMAQHPDPSAGALRAGRRWGESRCEPFSSRRAAGKEFATGYLVDVLDELGFAPERARRNRSEVRLRHCPFLGLVDAYGPEVCSLHLGVMQGALNATGAPITVERLDPFVEPDLCVAHLGHRPKPESGGGPDRGPTGAGR